MQSRAGWGNGPAIGHFTTPFARVLRAALAARKVGKPFRAADVTDDMIVAELHVIATSQEAALDDSTVASVQSVLVTARGNKNPGEAIHPLRTRELTAEYKNLYGLAFQQPGTVAIFPLTVLTSEHQIHIVFDRIAKGFSALTMCKDCVVPFPMMRVR